MAEKKTAEAMQKYAQMLDFVKNLLMNTENELKRINVVIEQLSNFDPSNPESLTNIPQVDESFGWEDLSTYQDEENIQVVEWKFDGYFMVWANQKKYPVPLNYASKTKLVPWDTLKLKIMAEWKFVYKLIRPVERKHIKATLSKTDESKFVAMSEDGKVYFLNQAAVTFFKWKPWDELYIITNAEWTWWFAAIEAVIKK